MRGGKQQGISFSVKAIPQCTFLATNHRGASCRYQLPTHARACPFHSWTMQSAKNSFALTREVPLQFHCHFQTPFCVQLTRREAINNWYELMVDFDWVIRTESVPNCARTFLDWIVAVFLSLCGSKAFAWIFLGGNKLEISQGIVESNKCMLKILPTLI